MQAIDEANPEAVRLLSTGQALRGNWITGETVETVKPQGYTLQEKDKVDLYQQQKAEAITAYQKTQSGEGQVHQLLDRAVQTINPYTPGLKVFDALAVMAPGVPNVHLPGAEPGELRPSEQTIERVDPIRDNETKISTEPFPQLSDQPVAPKATAATAEPAKPVNPAVDVPNQPPVGETPKPPSPTPTLPIADTPKPPAPTPPVAETPKPAEVTPPNPGKATGGATDQGSTPEPDAQKAISLNEDLQRVAQVENGNVIDPSNRLVVATEQKTIDLRDPKWTNTTYAKGDDSIVYILRDADTGQAMKVGKSEVSNFEERFDDYVSAQKVTGRNLKVETIAFDSTKVTPEKVESQIRNHLEKQQEELPWDNTKQRLGRPGPGVPGGQGSKKLQSEGWHWSGENYVK